MCVLVFVCGHRRWLTNNPASQSFEGVGGSEHGRVGRSHGAGHDQLDIDLLKEKVAVAEADRDRAVDAVHMQEDTIDDLQARCRALERRLEAVLNRREASRYAPACACQPHAHPPLMRLCCATRVHVSRGGAASPVSTSAALEVACAERDAARSMLKQLRDEQCVLASCSCTHATLLLTSNTAIVRSCGLQKAPWPWPWGRHPVSAGGHCGPP